MMRTIPSKAKVVIVGGGVIGCSIAYHLTKLGWSDVVLLERKQLTCGTTWHAAGLLTTLRSTENATKLAKYTQDLYAKLEEETGLSTGIMRVGSLQIAADPERLEEMRRGCAMAGIFGVESREVTPEQVQELWPLADTSDILAGFYFPADGRTNPTDTTMSLAKGARLGGATIIEGVKVLDVIKRGDRIVAVTTDAGDIEAEYVVNSTGMWAREFGKRAGVNVPLQGAEHYYLITEALDGMHADLPILRDPANVAYYREETGKLMLGLFEPVAATWGERGIPEQFCFDELPADWERMTPYLEKAMQRIPSMANVGVRILFNGPESFTPDHNYLMGRAPGLRNYYVAAGFNSLGILSGGGAGMVLANWIVNGHPPMDVFDSDIRRVHDFQGNAKYLLDRTVESLGIGYQHHWPFRQWESARNVKKLVLHDRVAAAGACFGESAGWERPNWYAPGCAAPQYEYTFKRQNWFEFNAQEHRAVRENVGLFEQSSFSKFLVQGRDAEKVLDHVSANSMAVPVGKAVYTQFLNDRGGIEADLTVTRLGSEEFLVVTAAFTHGHVLAWLREHVPDDSRCWIADVTGSYGMLNLQGPRSRELLAQLTDCDLSLEAFPFGTMQDLDFGYQRVKALRISYVGELGWELYVPTEYLLPVYDQLVEAGREMDLRHCGYHTLNSLRIEKAYREWAHDIGADDTPIEAGLGFACDFGKPGGFIGREALLRQKEAGTPVKRLVQFLLKDPEPLLYHAEPIIIDGEPNGFTTSAMYGHTLGGAVALGYVNKKDGVTQEWLDRADIRINVAGQLVPAVGSLKPLYDPASRRIRV